LFNYSEIVRKNYYNRADTTTEDSHTALDESQKSRKNSFYKCNIISLSARLVWLSFQYNNNIF